MTNMIDMAGIHTFEIHSSLESALMQCSNDQLETHTPGSVDVTVAGKECLPILRVTDYELE